MTPTTRLIPCSRPTNVNQLAWKLRPKRIRSPKDRQPRSDGSPTRVVSSRVSSVPTTARTTAADASPQTPAPNATATTAKI